MNRHAADTTRAPSVRDIASAETPSRDGAAKGDAPRILLVDDEPTFRTSTSQMLCRRGYRCDAAPDAHIAARMLEAHAYAVVIADLRMPGNHDLEFVRGLCEAPVRPAVILLTAYPSMESALSGVDLHLAGYLVKPVDLDDLAKRIDGALEEVRARQSLERIRARLSQAEQDTAALQTLMKSSREVEPGTLREVLDLTLARVVSAFLEPEPTCPTRGDKEAPGGAEPDPPAELSALTPREREVLEKLIGGRRVAAISTDLGISPHTVRNHLKKIFRKLGVNSQVELVGRLNARARAATSMRPTDREDG